MLKPSGKIRYGNPSELRKGKRLDRDMQPFELEGTELLARCICHECDHLDGHMYTEKVEGELWDNTYDEYEEYEDEE